MINILIMKDDDGNDGNDDDNDDDDDSNEVLLVHYPVHGLQAGALHWEMKSSWSAPSSPNLMVVLVVLCHGHDGFDRDDVSDFLVEILHQPEAHLVRGKNVYSIP